MVCKNQRGNHQKHTNIASNGTIIDFYDNVIINEQAQISTIN